MAKTVAYFPSRELASEAKVGKAQVQNHGDYFASKVGLKESHFLMLSSEN